MTLATKLSAVMAAIDKVEKRGSNESQDYKYVKAVDVARRVREELIKVGVLFLLDLHNVESRVVERGQKSPVIIFTISGDARFVDTEDGSELSFGIAGAGGDYGGEKGLYKAITGAIKYALRTAFLIPDEADDPEVDQRDPDAGRTNSISTPTGASITVLGAANVGPSSPDKLASERQRAHIRATAREKGIDGQAFKVFVLAITDKQTSKELTVADYEKLIATLNATDGDAAAMVAQYAAWSDEAAPDQAAQ